jgi:hypothetical protein
MFFSISITCRGFFCLWNIRRFCSFQIVHVSVAYWGCSNVWSMLFQIFRIVLWALLLLLEWMQVLSKMLRLDRRWRGVLLIPAFLCCISCTRWWPVNPFFVDFGQFVVCLVGLTKWIFWFWVEQDRIWHPLLLRKLYVDLTEDFSCCKVRY